MVILTPHCKGLTGETRGRRVLQIRRVFSVPPYSQAADVPRPVLCSMFLGGAPPTPSALETAPSYLWPD